MNVEVQNAFLSYFPLFNVLSVSEREQLTNMLDYKIVPKYGVLYTPGDASDTLYFLSRGVVKIATHSMDGKEVIKALIHPTAVFGELGMVGELQRQDFAQALREDVHIYLIKTEDFKQLMSKNFELCSAFMGLIGSRLIRAEDKLESLIFKDARTRIIDFIKESVNDRGRKVGYEMLLKHSLTHQDIANITCTSRQTVTLVLNELRKSDLIYFNRGKILVRDMTRLN